LTSYRPAIENPCVLNVECMAYALNHHRVVRLSKGKMSRRDVTNV
jgi:hypothetical protein